MPFITRDLLRKRAEHNEGIISSLEEISLHQEELESINDILGNTCRKLKILYLQNNIISKLENLQHMKQLEYLNVALNNITKIEGLQNCEFLKKLDMTMNFIDFDTLEESIAHLVPHDRLHTLYMMGNPSQVNWGENFNTYLIAKLPNLQSLDGTEITKSMQIIAKQKLSVLEVELRLLAESKRLEKLASIESSKASKDTAICEPRVVELSDNGEAIVTDVTDEIDEVEEAPVGDYELTENTPETRVKIYRELAEQKKEKTDRDKVNQPKDRNYELEQLQTVEDVRKKEEASEEQEIKQKNEGGWNFVWDEESRPGHVVLDVQVSSFLDSSLMDVDIHPAYVSIIIKSKLLRLRLPAEVKVSESKCQRSKVSGSLMIIMPKVNPKENAITVRGDIKAKQRQQTNKSSSSAEKKIDGRSKLFTKKLSIAEQMQQEFVNNQTSNLNLNDSDSGTSGIKLSNRNDLTKFEYADNQSSSGIFNICKQDANSHAAMSDSESVDVSVRISRLPVTISEID